MQVKFIGTGTMGSIYRNNTSILIDNILFDCGMGTVKQLEKLKIYTKSIKYIVISHFHADHFFDIPNFLIGRRIRNENKTYKLTIIGPIGIRQKIIDMMTFSFGDGDEHHYDDIENKYNIEFIELKSEENYHNDNFELKALKLKHGNCNPINGYILEKENKRIAYACDTTFCDNYYKMVDSTDYIFSDVNSLETTDMHIGLNDYKELYKKFENCKFYAVHRGDYEVDKVEGVYFPDDGEDLYI